PRSHAAEHVAENILEPAEPAAASAGAAEPFGSPGEGLEMACASEPARPPPGARRLETVESRLALGIDLAAIERLALLLVAEHLVGGVEFGKLCRRFCVLLVGVGMQLFRQPPEGSFDLLLASRLLHPQDIIGVAHPFHSDLLRKFRQSAVPHS